MSKAQNKTNNTKTICSLSHLHDWVEEQKKSRTVAAKPEVEANPNDACEFLYRGHSDKNYTLLPSAYRLKEGKSFRAVEYNLYQETKEKKAIDLSVRLIEEMKKEDLDIEEKIEIVKSEKPNKKFKEIKYGFSHSEKNEKLELDNLKIKLQKSREMLKKYQLQISKLEEKIAAIINKS